MGLSTVIDPRSHRRSFVRRLRATLLLGRREPERPSAEKKAPSRKSPMPSVALLPDCRPKRPREMKRAVMLVNGIPRVTISERVFCGNCGKKGPFVTSGELAPNFLFWLCTGCQSHGCRIDGTYAVPDALMRQRVIEAQKEETAGRMMSLEEIRAALEAPSSPLSKLVREYQGRAAR
jgi:hypothetical protein